MDLGNLPTHATASALEALQSVGMQNSFPAGAAVTWLMNNESTSTDSLARTVRALARAGADASVSLEALNKNRTGYSFGSYRGYSPSMPDTALGLDALLTAGKLTFSWADELPQINELLMGINSAIAVTADGPTYSCIRRIVTTHLPPCRINRPSSRPRRRS